MEMLSPVLALEPATNVLDTKAPEAPKLKDSRMSVSKDLRAIECEINVAYRDNPLLSLPRTQAIWYFLAQCEELYMVRHVREKPPDRAFSDSVINLAKWPCRWLWNDCRADGKLPRRHQTDIYYVPAQEMADLGRNYEWFEAAFTYTTKSRLSLQLDGHTIRPKWHNCDHVRDDAYDRLRDVADDGTEVPNDTVLDADIASTLDIVKRTVRLPLGLEAVGEFVEVDGLVLP